MPSWARGLKSAPIANTDATTKVVPSWARGLKFVRGDQYVAEGESRALMGTWIEMFITITTLALNSVVPSWARGLKFYERMGLI